MVGVGVSIGGDPACFIIEQHLNRFIEGQVSCTLSFLLCSSFSLID
jgi:hypothetical protein